MEKTCLIIDDNKQDEVLEQLVEKARKKGIVLKCPQFNVGSTERSDLLDAAGAIDTNVVIEKFKAEFTGIKLDMICVDFQLEDENINGLDVLKVIYEHRKSSQYMIYSSSIDQVASGIIETYDKDKNKSQLINRIKSLTRYNIRDFVPRERYDQAILEIIGKDEVSLELALEAKLLEYPDLIFQNTYPVFEGRSLQDIAAEIRVDSHHGKRFKVELIEQAIAYMLKINEQ